MKVFFDTSTSVVLPMAVDTSLSNRLANRLWLAGFAIVLSPGVLREVGKKLSENASLRRWLRTTDRELREFLAGLLDLCLIAPGILTASGEVPGDPDDDHLLAAALETASEFIVSEDRHLLDPRVWRGSRS